MPQDFKDDFTVHIHKKGRQDPMWQSARIILHIVFVHLSRAFDSLNHKSLRNSTTTTTTTTLTTRSYIVHDTVSSCVLNKFKNPLH